VRTTSGWDPATAAGQRVDVLTRGGAVPGVIAAKRQKRKRGEGRQAIERDDLFLDVGAKDGDELRRLIRPGDNVIWHGAPLPLHGSRVASRCFDNRVGCYVALEAARRIAEAGGSPGDVIAAAVVQEEVGDYAGARTVAFATEPDVAVAIDVTNTSDVRGADAEDEGKIVLGGGPTVARGPSLHPDVFELLHDAAESEGIPFAVEVTSSGDTYTDADALYLSRTGVATGLIGIPLRYMHSPVETLDLDDVEQAVQLIVVFASKLEPGLSFTG
jgi:putative aminopeptidase FrvX